MVCRKKSSTSSKKFAGRGELWSPSNTRSGFESPAYFSRRRAECALSMKSSSSPCAKSAGQNVAFATRSISSSSMSNEALVFMLERIHPAAIFVAARGTPMTPPAVHFSTSSAMRSRSDANGESSTIPAMEGSSFAASSAVTAPMLVPHRPILPTRPPRTFVRKCSMTLATSVFSRAPSETCSPSLSPLPPKSSANTSTPIGSRRRTAFVASHRLPLLPCR
jgi:hypothetical protein